MSCCLSFSSSCSTHFPLENVVWCLLTDHSCVFLSALPGGHLNLTAACNAECHCLQETYSPVCGSDDIMYYSPCHAGCKRVSKNLRNGKKVCLTAIYINEAATHLWSDLAGSAKVSFVANQCKSSMHEGCSQKPPGMIPRFASLSASNRFCLPLGQTVEICGKSPKQIKSLVGT